MTPEQKKDVTHYIVLNVLVICAYLFIMQDESWKKEDRADFVLILAFLNAILALIKSNVFKP